MSQKMFKMKIYVCFRSKIVSFTSSYENIRDVLFVQEGICERTEN